MRVNPVEFLFSLYCKACDRKRYKKLIGSEKGEEFEMQKKSSFIGLIAGMASIILWLVFHFFNPYSNQISYESMFTTFLMLVLPACLAIYSFYKSKKLYMLIAFIWSLPLSLYMLLTPGVFLLFGITSVMYLLSYVLMRK
ncbi:hypothetical protein V7122_00630 [Bacillus sp. JJ1532]|uniref:hypothetical protein n=1 Tax=Bacillus sp. JJ1532 TaxID=3122958 RepID=UPI002FFDD1CF